MELPSVTVGMPVYNDPEGLRRTVPTVFAQTWPGRIRLLVIDDGSTDDTAEVLASLSGLFKGIEVVRHATNQGRPFARNKILDLAGDDYLAWVDAGDVWHPRKLELQLAALLEAEREDPSTPYLCTAPLRWVFADRGADRVKVPDTAGDQLKSALIGKLFPYLQALVGRSEHFRAVGGFDERLLRRQDYDFLVRFLVAGGRLTSTPPTIPLFTYLKSDLGASAKTVAASNEVIRQKHRPYYRRYGRGLTLRVRSKQDRLVARFYRHNGQTWRGLPYLVRSFILRPNTGKAARSVARLLLSPGQVARAGARQLARISRPALRWLRDAGAVELVRRVGPLRRLARTAPMRAVRREVNARPEDAAKLEEEVQAPGASVRTWLRLEQAYRLSGRLHSAEIALRRALDIHRGEPRITVRLIELLPLRRRWADTVELWKSLGDSGRAHRTGLTYARVARCLRELGASAQALAVAMEGARRWPDDPTLAEEVYVGRAALVDWSQAMKGTGHSAELGPLESIGEVKSLGTLTGGETPIEGVVTSTPGRAATVSLLLNGTPVASTGLAAGPDGATFSLNCDGLLRYLGDNDDLSFECAGRALSIEGYGLSCRVTTGYESRAEELLRKLAAGYIFTKFGVLRMGNTPDRKQRILGLYSNVSDVLSESFGYTAMPFYGNLLGAIRDNDFIPHDVGGFDMGYVSHQAQAQDVRREFIDICRRLVDCGYQLRLEPWSVYISRVGTSVYVDLNYAWFNQRSELELSFGWRYAPITDRDHFFYPRDCPIGKHLVPVPGNAEAVLEQIYGSSWAVPEQGFALESRLQRNANLLLTRAEQEEIFAYAPDQVLIRSAVPDGDIR